MAEPGSVAQYLVERSARSIPASRAYPHDIRAQRLDHLHQVVTAKLGVDDPALRTLEAEVIQGGGASPGTIVRVNSVINSLCNADAGFASNLNRAVEELEQGQKASGEKEETKVGLGQSKGVQFGDNGFQYNDFSYSGGGGLDHSIGVHIIGDSGPFEITSSGLTLSAEIYCHGQPRSLEVSIDGYPPDCTILSPRTLDVSDGGAGHVQIHLRMMATKPAGGKRPVRLVVRDKLAPRMQWISNETQVVVPKNPGLELSATGEVSENPNRTSFPWMGCLLGVSVKNCGNVPLQGNIIVANVSEAIGSSMVAFDAAWASTNDCGAFALGPGSSGEVYVPLLVRRSALTKPVDFHLTAEITLDENRLTGFSSPVSLRRPGVLPSALGQFKRSFGNVCRRIGELARRHTVRNQMGRPIGVTIFAAAGIAAFVALIGTLAGFSLRGQTAAHATNSTGRVRDESLPSQSRIASPTSGVTSTDIMTLPTPSGYTQLPCESGQSVAFLKAIRPQSGGYAGREDVLIRYLYDLESQRIRKSPIGSGLDAAALPQELHISKGDAICGAALKNYPGADARWRFLWLGPFPSSKSRLVCSVLKKPSEWDCGTAKISS
jgi:hypothetical protein